MQPNKKKRNIKDEILEQFNVEEVEDSDPFLPVFLTGKEKTLSNEIVIDYSVLTRMIAIVTTFPEVIDSALEIGELREKVVLDEDNKIIRYHVRVHDDQDMTAAVAHCFQAALAIAQDLVIVGETFDIWKS